MDSDQWISRLAAAKRHYALRQQQSSHSDRFDVDEYELEEEVRPDFHCPICYEDHDIISLCSHLEDDHPFESKAAPQNRHLRYFSWLLRYPPHDFFSSALTCFEVEEIAEGSGFGAHTRIVALRLPSLLFRTVCPICSVKVTGDMLSHILLQHGNIVKVQRHRRLRRVAIPNSQALSLLGRDLREAHLQVLLGSGAYRSSNSSTSTAAADSLLSSIVINFPASEAEETSKSSLSHVDEFIRKKSATTRTWNSSIDLSLSQEEREKKQRQATDRANFVHDLLLSTLFGD